MKRTKKEQFISMAIDFAERSCARGNHPFGAVLEIDGQIVLSAENTVITDQDCTAHAEMNLIRLACSSFDTDTRKGAVLYSSTEPCAMCAGAIYWAGIRAVVYGCSITDLARFTTGSFVVPCREIFYRGKERTFVDGPYTRDKRAISIHARYWSSSP